MESFSNKIKGRNMELSTKLQALRKQKNITQQELADSLHVSRTAVSKWESGRGYPNIDSLKDIAVYFSVTIDDLLASNEVLRIAENEQDEKRERFQDVIFGWVDLGMVLLFFLPFFAERMDSVTRAVPLITLMQAFRGLDVFYLLAVCGMVISGALTLLLQKVQQKWWLFIKKKVSILASICAIGIFIVGLQPYPAVFVFSGFLIKLMMLINWK